MNLGLLAIVGAPSSGKSTIFNRILTERKAIVEPTPGVTRDRLYGKASWLTREFSVVDTGGLQIEDAPFQEQIRDQVNLALDEADVICFVVDSKVGVTKNDRYIASLLRKSEKPIILVANKVDRIEEAGYAADFYSLGLGEPLLVSGAHGIGIGDLLDKVIALLPEKETPDYGDAITFSFIGRPNVGKSSLSNRLLGESRTIVSDISGTTRDSIDIPFSKDGKNYVAIDTAGLVKRGRIYESIDKYAALRALSAIERSDIALLLIDASNGILEQDKHVVGYAVDEHKAVIVVVNKWDLAKENSLQRLKFTQEIRNQFKFLDYAPILFVSAETGWGCETILPAIEQVHEAYNRRIATPLLNNVIRDAQDMNPTPYFNHGRLKIFFANQVTVAPPTFVLFCNDPKTAHFSYTRYLENRIRESFDFAGTPIQIIYRERK